MDDTKRILFSGGRDFKDAVLVERTMLELAPNSIVVGDALGLDTLAVSIARRHHIPVFQFFADWKLFGPSAGLNRNQQMLVVGAPVSAVLFKGGRGTYDMYKRLRANKIPVTLVGFVFHEGV